MTERAGSTRRVFFALWPDEAQREELERAASKAMRRSGGRPVPPSNLHVTLAFLGSIPVTRMAELQHIGNELAPLLAAHAPISLTFTRLVHWKDAQVLCALTAPESAGASALAVALQEATAAIGFSPDRRPFQAHVTLARKVLRPGPLLRLRALTWQFDAFALIDSRTEPSGPVYSVIDTYPLVADKVHQ
jgi:2'-5' RNA ligase